MISRVVSLTVVVAGDDAGLQSRGRIAEHEGIAIAGKVHPPKILRIESSLVRKVMNREQSPRVLEEWFVPAAREQRARQYESVKRQRAGARHALAPGPEQRQHGQRQECGQCRIECVQGAALL